MSSLVMNLYIYLFGCETQQIAEPKKNVYLTLNREVTKWNIMLNRLSQYAILN